MWISLHTHSYFSFLQGLASPLELAQAAAAQKMPALALTDSQMLTGAIEFYDACRTCGVRPILGLEIPVRRESDRSSVDGSVFNNNSRPASSTAGNLVLLAQDLHGWSNLCQISTILQTGMSPAISFEQLSNHRQSLICLSGGRRGWAAENIAKSANGEAAALFDELAGVFDGRFYFEMQAWDAEISQADLRWCLGLLGLARRLGLPIVASVDAHYLNPQDSRLQKVACGIRLNTPYQELAAEQYAIPGSYFMSEAQLHTALEKFPIANPQGLIDASLQVAERCRLDLPLGVHHYPEIDLPDGVDAERVLRQRAEQGAIELYGELTPEIAQRLDHEIETIKTCGYTSLFLIMQEILNFARRDGVPFSSRGSAASSLVAHCLGITSPDPIRLNLYFERFLNPMRVTPPDIDTDLCSRRRERVIRFVYRRFGDERVAMVSTINRFRSRSALREVAKAYGLSPGKVNRLVEKLPHRWYGPPGRESSEDPFGDLVEEMSEPVYLEIFRDARAMIGIPRHLSIHPGGVVIAPDELTRLAPLQLALKGLSITQFDLTSIERLGLLKIDLLGIRGLTVLGDVAETASSSHPSERQPQATILNFLDSIPRQDAETSQTIQNARTIGCFQIESPGMRATLREIQAKTPSDLMVALALYRPGPLTGGLKDTFVKRYRAQVDPKKALESGERDYYLHPSLQPLLEETYGVILYQEQVLRIGHELAGFSLSDADQLRRAMSHFDLDKQMIALKEKFILGADKNSHVPAGVAERIWELMAAFAGYGFPKAHAASYAEISWRAAWCKTHYPAVFMAAVLANWGGYYSQRVYLTEARRMGLNLKPPLVNAAREEFGVTYVADQPVLVMGLNQVRDLTQRTIGRILRERPFISLADFLARVDPKSKEAENLIRVGAFEEFGEQPALLFQLSRGGVHPGQLSLFSDPIYPSGKDVSEPEWTLADKVAAQESLLGVSLIAHPLELHARAIAASGALTSLDAAARLGQQVRVAGVRQTWRRSRTQRGDPIYFMTIEDLEGMLNVIISGDVYQKYRHELSGSGPYIIEGVTDLNPATDELTIRANRITRVAST